MKNIIIILIVVLAAAGAYWYWGSGAPERGGVLSSAVYMCLDGKSIEATYYEGGSEVVVSEGEPPVPSGSVDIKLSDGREMTLPQTLSASGVRFANTDESLIFWNKGNEAFIFEGEVETYSGCVAQ